MPVCVQVIEVDVNGNKLRTFSRVEAPRHLSLDSQCRVFVADFVNHHILLLNSQLQQDRVVVHAHSRVKLWQPTRLCFNESTSQLYVVYGVESKDPSTCFVSIFNYLV